MRTLIVALTIAAISIPAYAETAGTGGVPAEASSRENQANRAAQREMQKKDRVESERAYKKALDAIPNAQKPYDPWGTVRP